MNWNEGSIGHKITIRGKQSARKVQAFFYIRADGGLLQGTPHGLCNAHKAIGEEGEQDRIRTLGVWDYCRGHLCLKIMGGAKWQSGSETATEKGEYVALRLGVKGHVAR